MRARAHRLVVGLVALALVAPVATAVAASRPPSSSGGPSTGPYAPLDRPGPPLSVPRARLRAALRCAGDLQHARHEPVLLVPGTNLDPGRNFSWNYERGFAARRWAFCSVTLPFHSMGDVQVAGEYVVYALRTMARRSRHKVEVLGYSQGGMLPRWALRFWPDTRRLVDDVVGLDPSNHGTLDAQALCRTRCPPAYWQQASGSHFYAALNSGAETFRGIDYTVVFSRDDEVVVPNTDTSGSSSLHSGRGHIANIAVQAICPTDPSEHLAMGTYDAVGYALVLDAFTHRGTAVVSRVPPSVCGSPLAPEVDPAGFPASYAEFLSAIATAAATSPETAHEPPLTRYVFR